MSDDSKEGLKKMFGLDKLETLGRKWSQPLPTWKQVKKEAGKKYQETKTKLFGSKPTPAPAKATPKKGPSK